MKITIHAHEDMLLRECIILFLCGQVVILLKALVFVRLQVCGITLLYNTPCVMPEYTLLHSIVYNAAKTLNVQGTRLDVITYTIRLNTYILRKFEGERSGPNSFHSTVFS